MTQHKHSPSKKTDALALGQHAEALVAAWLEQQGMTLCAQNYRCRRGELDLIMEDTEALYFIEVRSLSNADPNRAIATITPTKCCRIQAAAQHYLAHHASDTNKAILFECVGVSYQRDGSILCQRQPMTLC